MSLKFTSLSSGSNGNCYYIGNEEDAILVDAGISCRETESRLSKLGLNIKNVRAIFISHEHSDHIRGVEVLSRRNRIPVYISALTCLNDLVPVEQELMRTFSGSEKIAVASLSIQAFPKQHDSIDPYSFTVSFKGITVGVFTDIGEACKNVIHHFSQCHAAFLEANYDDEMLDKGQYPAFLKKRIKSSVGHLSNQQAFQLYRKHKSPYLSHLLLSHLSEHNNHPELVHELFSQHAGKTKIEVAPRYKEMKVLKI